MCWWEVCHLGNWRLSVPSSAMGSQRRCVDIALVLNWPHRIQYFCRIQAKTHSWPGGHNWLWNCLIRSQVVEWDRLNKNGCWVTGSRFSDHLSPPPTWINIPDQSNSDTKVSNILLEATGLPFFRRRSSSGKLSCWNHRRIRVFASQ